MHSARIQLIATTIFALGFILAGSGWSSVLTSLIDGRPSWSVCGQEMCSCVKPTDASQSCPLCSGGVDQSTLLGSCDTNSSTEPTQPTKRVPKNNDSLNALGNAGTTAAIAFFVGTMITQSNTTHDLNTQRDQIVATDQRRPYSRNLDLPTPPPRA